MMQQNNGKLLVVDDDKEIVRVLRSYLEKEGFIVFTAYDGEAAFHILQSERPDLMILDLMMPKKDGWDVTRTVRHHKYLQEIPIIMLTAKIEDVDKIIGLELGADDYITKPFNPREVIARVRSILRRTQMIEEPSTLLQSGYLQLDTQRQKISLHGEVINFTPTELKIIETLLREVGKVLTRDQIIEQAFGYQHLSLDRTLDNHIRNIRKKIESDPSNPIYIQTVYGIGYRLQEIIP